MTFSSHLASVYCMYKEPGLQTKKLSKEPLAPIRKKLRRQIIFLGATE